MQDNMHEKQYKALQLPSSFVSLRSLQRCWAAARRSTPPVPCSAATVSCRSYPPGLVVARCLGLGYAAPQYAPPLPRIRSALPAAFHSGSCPQHHGRGCQRRPSPSWIGRCPAILWCRDRRLEVPVLSGQSLNTHVRPSLKS